MLCVDGGPGCLISRAEVISAIICQMAKNLLVIASGSTTRAIHQFEAALNRKAKLRKFELVAFIYLYKVSTFLFICQSRNFDMAPPAPLTQAGPRNRFKPGTAPRVRTRLVRTGVSILLYSSQNQAHLKTWSIQRKQKGSSYKSVPLATSRRAAMQKFQTH